MQEITVNIHMHTRYSDGSGSHGDIAAAALRRGLDAVIVTDHNVLVRGIDQYVGEKHHRILLLVGEEVHDRSRSPQADHLLVIGTDQEAADLGDDTGALIRRAHRAGGLTFLAHPNETAAPVFHEPDISWTNWSVREYTGIELWNGFSELKSLLHTRTEGIFYAFFPALVPHGPPRKTLALWDELLLDGPVIAIGGSDAHALKTHLGPLSRVVYPYEHHFGAVNTHLLIDGPLTGDAIQDAGTIYNALGAGHAFVGCDLHHSSRGFRFTAHGMETQVIMGDRISHRGGLTLQARVPAFAELRLIRDGHVMATANRAQALVCRVDQPGTYRLEAYRRTFGRRRGWIFSNPIYVY